METVLPAWYAAAFAAPAAGGDEGVPHVYAYRPWVGEWKRAPVLPPGADAPHFNRLDPGEDRAGLGADLDALAAEAAPLLGALEAPRAVSPRERRVLARVVAVLGVRNARHADELDPAQLRAGAESFEQALLEMGWVLWVAPPNVHWVTGSDPLHAAYPAGDESRTAAFDVVDGSVELTFPLTPKVALHGTWARRGELWRTAREEVLMELNARTCASSRRFLVAPKPSLPG